MRLKPAVHAPQLLSLMKGLATRIPTNGRVFRALKEYGEFTDAQALEALRYGTDPDFRLVRLSPTVWGHVPDTGLYVELNEKFIEQFENLSWVAKNYSDPYELDYWRRLEQRRHWMESLDQAELRIEALILHELVHWGDLRVYPGSAPDKVKRQDDRAQAAGFEDLGHQFVESAYGGRLSFRQNERGLTIADHGIDWWLGTLHITDKTYAYYTPLSDRRPAPLRPPFRAR